MDFTAVTRMDGTCREDKFAPCGKKAHWPIDFERHRNEIAPQRLPEVCKNLPKFNLGSFFAEGDVKRG
jgi:hypothetical protein